MQDDALLLHGPTQRVRQAAQEMRELGVDRVRLTAGWSVLAPAPQERQRPAFNASDSREYPQSGWLYLDRAVKEVLRAGMQPMIDVAFFAPRWAVQRGSPRDGRHRWKPSPAEFGRFTEAVARRYDGKFPDPRDPDGKLPAVRLWTTWNEPNHATFLLPQWQRERSRRARRARWRAVSPHVYRRMHQAGYEALKRVDGQNKVLIGGLSFGGDKRKGARQNMSPLVFTRELACVDSRLRPLRRRECRRFTPLQADGFAHHPYSLPTVPDAADPDRGNVRLAELDRLAALLGALHSRGRIAAPLSLYLTEYGYETNPPDAARGVSPEAQALYLGHATYLAWRRPEVRAFSQFLLQDMPPDLSRPEGPRRWDDYQTGLVHHDGRAKPALKAFKLPFWAQRAVADGGREGALAFGQVRPGSGLRQMALEMLTERGWEPVASAPISGGADQACPSFATDPHGFFERFVAVKPGTTLRAIWHRLDGAPVDSTPVAVPADRPALPVGSLLRPR